MNGTRSLKNILFKASAEHLVDFHTAKRTILESLNKNASATIEFRKDDEGILKEKWKEIRAHNIMYLSLGNLANINGVDIYPNKKMIDLFFYEVEATDVAYISIHGHEDNQGL